MKRATLMENMKSVYKKSLMVELVRMGNDLAYTTRNPANEKYQIYYFKDNDKLRQDLAFLTKHEYVKEPS